jgi:hypothetical protein
MFGVVFQVAVHPGKVVLARIDRERTEAIKRLKSEPTAMPGIQ